MSCIRLMYLFSVTVLCLYQLLILLRLSKMCVYMPMSPLRRGDGTAEGETAQKSDGAPPRELTECGGLPVSAQTGKDDGPSMFPDSGTLLSGPRLVV